MKFSIITFGCKVNFCESESICENLIKNNFLFCENFQNADIVIVNSCTVTAESDRKIRQKINKIKKLNPKCILVLTGCMAEIAHKNNQTIKFVDILIGNKSAKAVVLAILNKNAKKIDKYNFEDLSLNTKSKRTRAFLKIQDGCDRFCTYCIIPFARGSVRSKSLEEIRKDTEKLAENGYKEIVLVGINISLYGLDIGYNLADAVHCVCEVFGIERVRFSSLEPEILDENLILKISQEKKICPQFHLSLQSGSNKILKRMGRKYDRDQYLKIVNNIKKHFKNATFTTDLMVGFPGETDEDFKDSLDLILKVNFLKVHIFPYSPRPGTKAATFDEQVIKKIKSERVKKAIEISKISENLVLMKNKDKTMRVLFETYSKNEKGENIYEGYTENYIHIKKVFNEDVRGKIIKIHFSGPNFN